MPKIVDHDAYREELVAQAVKYFSDHGYAGASMRKIADHLGVSKSAIYHYFPSKADLFLACTKHMMSSSCKTRLLILRLYDLQKVTPKTQLHVIHFDIKFIPTLSSILHSHE